MGYAVLIGGSPTALRVLFLVVWLLSHLPFSSLSPSVVLASNRRPVNVEGDLHHEERLQPLHCSNACWLHRPKRVMRLSQPRRKKARDGILIAGWNAGIFGRCLASSLHILADCYLPGLEAVPTA